MSVIILHRIDAAQRMRRFTGLTCSPIYSGNGVLSGNGGRIGRAGQVRVVPYAAATEAHEALAPQQRVKQRRGYASKEAGRVVCTRRSNNPSVKRPDIPVAPEQKSGSR